MQQKWWNMAPKLFIIAELLQKMSAGLEKPEMLCQSNLPPLPKPPKEGVNVNVGPIIFLSNKIISICMINRCYGHLKTLIPP